MAEAASGAAAGTMAVPAAATALVELEVASVPFFSAVSRGCALKNFIVYC